MRQADIQPGAELYWAPGREWRVVTPVKAVVVDGARVRIVTSRNGPFTGVSHVPDPAGNAIVVDLHEGARVRQVAVRVRDLRGLWAETLAVTGRTVAGVKARGALVHELAASGRPVNGGGLLGLAARDERMGDGTFVALSQAVDGRTIEH